MGNSEEVQRFADGDVYFWIEDGGAIHLKAVTPHGDPTELTAEMARELAEALLAAANQLDGKSVAQAVSIRPFAHHDSTFSTHLVDSSDTLNSRKGNRAWSRLLLK